ncbi:MAG: hypothetical protein AAFR52_18660 [Pseudomonadota bacterium]
MKPWVLWLLIGIVSVVGGILALGRMMSAAPGVIEVSLEMHAAMALYACSFLVVYRRVASRRAVAVPAGGTSPA